MKVTAILTAAGKGARFSGKNATSGSLPKQFLNLRGKPVILYPLLAFQKSNLIDEILVSADKVYFDLIHNIALKSGIKKLTMLVEGGKTRFHSVKNAFNQINCKANDLILIHDAVRPNISSEMIKHIIKESIKSGEVIPAVRISETVKLVKNRIVTGTVDRKNLWTVQTPQVFRYKILKKAYERAGSKIDFTDEAALVENAGLKVKITEGARNNIKITTPDEIMMLKKIMMI